MTSSWHSCSHAFTFQSSSKQLEPPSASVKVDCELQALHLTAKRSVVLPKCSPAGLGSPLQPHMTSHRITRYIELGPVWLCMIQEPCAAPNGGLVQWTDCCKWASEQWVAGLQIWQLPALVKVRTLRGHKRGVWAAQFSPTQRALITSSGDRTLKMWSLQDGSCQRTFEGHLASVLQVSFLSAGQQVPQTTCQSHALNTGNFFWLLLLPEDF